MALYKRSMRPIVGRVSHSTSTSKPPTRRQVRGSHLMDSVSDDFPDFAPEFKRFLAGPPRASAASLLCVNLTALSASRALPNPTYSPWIGGRPRLSFLLVSWPRQPNPPHRTGSVWRFYLRRRLPCSLLPEGVRPMTPRTPRSPSRRGTLRSLLFAIQHERFGPLEPEDPAFAGAT